MKALGICFVTGSSSRAKQAGECPVHALVSSHMGPQIPNAKPAFIWQECCGAQSEF
jgi:hypothetical protein